MSKLKDFRYERPAGAILARRISEPRRFIQVVAGPRQVGKTTLTHQVVSRMDIPVRFASADDPTLRGAGWIAEQWDAARLEAGEGDGVLVIDEVQKAADWAEAVKRLWDEDTRAGRRLRVVLLGSAPLLLQQGLTESLAGRFELIRLTHWSAAEMHAAFGWGPEQFVFYGGYPGAAPLISDGARWSAYIRDSLIETTISRDVLLLTRVDKPALLRRLFELSCRYSGQILSYNKMLGQLQDAGNTVTLANYLRLLDTAFLASGLELYSKGQIRKRGSSPKLILWNNALVSATALLSFEQALADGGWWGHLVENAVGAHLLNHLQGSPWSVAYWRKGGEEVDFVVSRGARTWAIEVKSGRGRKTSGLSAFKRQYPKAEVWVVGGGGVSLEDFFAGDVQRWFE